MNGAIEKQHPKRGSLRFPPGARLLKHAAFERVYQQGRRVFSGNMTVFYRPRGKEEEGAGGARVGFTVGRALGGAVTRNRIRRRLREAVRLKLKTLEAPVDVVINPKKTALTAGFRQLLAEVERAFTQITQRNPHLPKAGRCGAPSRDDIG